MPLARLRRSSRRTRSEDGTVAGFSWKLSRETLGDDPRRLPSAPVLSAPAGSPASFDVLPPVRPVVSTGGRA